MRAISNVAVGNHLAPVADLAVQRAAQLLAITIAAKDGTWQRIHEVMRQEDRCRGGRILAPNAAIIDSPLLSPNKTTSVRVLSHEPPIFPEEPFRGSLPMARGAVG